MPRAPVSRSAPALHALKQVRNITYLRVLQEPWYFWYICTMMAKKVSHRDPRLVQKQLEYLYSRRSAVETLIRSLENYAEGLAKASGQKDRQRA